MKSGSVGLTILLLLAIATITPLIVVEPKANTETTNSIPKTIYYNSKNNNLNPTTITGKTETITRNRASWTQPPGAWWNTDWEYRINITIQNNDVDRTNWPITTTIYFNPPAHKYSIRVIDNLMREIPSQLSDIVYYNDTHISSANITFLVNLTASETKTYAIYWKTEYVDPPLYPKEFSISETATAEGTVYIITNSKGWQFELPATKGGLLENITTPSGDGIGSGPNIHFGITTNGSTAYDDYWGNANTTVSYAERYIVGYDDPLLRAYYLGVIFVPYKIENAPLVKEDGTTLGYANYTYLFFRDGVLVRENIHWITDVTSTDVYFSGWSLDQDDGARDYNFDRLYTPDGIIDFSSAKYPIISGELTQYYQGTPNNNNRRLYDPNTGLPAVLVIRVYFTAGNHTIKVVAEGASASSLGPDDYAFRVAAPNGTWLKFNGIVDSGDGLANLGTYYGIGDSGYLAWSYGQSLNVSITAPVDGWYFIFVESFDDDNNDGLPDRTYFSVYADDLTLVTGAGVYTPNPDTRNLIAYTKGDPTDDGYVYLRGSISLRDLEIPSEAVGVSHLASLNWSDTSDLDFAVYTPNSVMLGYNISSTANPSTIGFTPSSAGHYSIIVHKYYGDLLATPYDVLVTALSGPEFSDYDFSGNWNWFALYHGEKPLGVGIVKLSEVDGGSAYSAVDYIVHNEGNDSEVDYIFFARRYQGLSASAGTTMRLSYAVILWEPEGTTDAEKLALFDYYRNALTSTPNITLATKEKFMISVEVRVLDGNGEGISGARVDVLNGSTLVISTITDRLGSVIIDLYRYNYTLNVSVASLNKTFFRVVFVSYSSLEYTVYSNTTTIVFATLVKFMLHAESNTTTPFSIQNGYVLLTKADGSYKLYGYTNLTGWLIAYLERTDWYLSFKANESSDTWDVFYLYNDSSKTQIVGTAYPYATIKISLAVDQDYWLVDASITSGKIETELQLYETLSSISAVWGDSVNISVIFKVKDNATRVNGTIYWYLYDSNSKLLMNSSGDADNGFYSFIINTSDISAGEIYRIIINATPENTYRYLNPNPITVVLSVEERSTVANLYIYPSSSIYWNDTVIFRVYYSDYETSQFIPDATVKITLSKEDVYLEYTLVMSGDYYELVIPNFQYETGTYLVNVLAVKGNYSSAEITGQLIVKPRLTILDTPNIVETPWVDTYTINVSYTDYILGTTITDATVTMEIIDSVNSETIYVGTLTFNGHYYVGTIRIADLNISEGSYIIVISAERQYYVSQQSDITFVLRERRTHVDASTTYVGVIWGDEILVRFNYVDDDFNEYIPNATMASYSIYATEGESGISGVLFDVGNGSYLLRINSSDLGVGTFTMSVLLYKTHYEMKYRTVFLKIDPVPTILMADKTSLEMEWGGLATFELQYERTYPTLLGIENPDTYRFTVYIEGTTTAVYSGLLDIYGDGHFGVSIRSQILGIGRYTIQVRLAKHYFINQTIQLRLVIEPRATIAYTDYSNITLIWSQEITFNVYYEWVTAGEGIEGANVNVVVIDLATNNMVDSFTAVDIGGGIYRIHIKATYGLGSYIINVSFTKENYTDRFKTISLQVRSIPTVLSWGGITTIEVEWGEEISVPFRFLMWNGTPITNADTLVEISGPTTKTMALSEGDNGLYVFTINTSDIITSEDLLGTYTVSITLSKTYHDEKEASFAFTVVKVAARPSVTVLVDDVLVDSLDVDVEWGQIVVLDISIIRNSTGDVVKGVTPEYNVTPEAISVPIEETQYGYRITINTSQMKTFDEVGKYEFNFKFSKTFYEIGEFRFKIGVRKVAVDMKVTLAPPKEIYKTPIIGENPTTIIRFVLIHNRTNQPVTGAEVKAYAKAEVSGETIERELEVRETGSPGVYEVKIVWTNDMFPPGVTWEISIVLEKAKVNNVVVTQQKLLETTISLKTYVDYTGGTTNLHDVLPILPNMYVSTALFLTSLLTIAIIISVISYKLYMYYSLPWEVREIDKILKLINKGIFEYEVKPRTEELTEIVRSEL